MAVALNPADAPSWYQFITDFDNAYAMFYDNYNGLMAQGPYIQESYPEALADYNALLQDGSTVAYKLEQLKAQRDYIFSWLQWLQTGANDISTFISSAAQSTYDAAKAALGLSGIPSVRFKQTGLGYLLQVAEVIATLGTAYLIIQAVMDWINRAYQMAQRVNMHKQLTDQGASEAQATQTVNDIYGTPSTDFLGIPWSLLVWGALAIFLGPPLLKMIGDKNRG